MDHQAIRDLLALAALDRLEPDEDRALEEHLRVGCDQCQTDLRELREAASSLVLSLDPAGSRERVWQRLEARLYVKATETGRSPKEAGARPNDGRRPAVIWRTATFAIAAGIVAIAIYAGFMRAANNHQQDQLAAMGSRVTRLLAELHGTRRQVGALQRVLGEHLRLEKVLSAPDLRLIRLQSLAPARGASAIVAVSITHRTAVLRATRLPPTPPGWIYELWWITREHGPTAAGLFGATSGHPVIAAVSPPPAGEHVLATAVTLEPSGGASKPTGPMYLKGVPGAG